MTMKRYSTQSPIQVLTKAILRRRNIHTSFIEGIERWENNSSVKETGTLRKRLQNSLPFMMKNPSDWMLHIGDQSFDPEKRLEVKFEFEFNDGHHYCFTI